MDTVVRENLPFTTTRGIINCVTFPATARSYAVGLKLVDRHDRLKGRPAEFDLLGLRWDLLPEVFVPTFTGSTRFFSSCLPYPVGGSFLEVGCGTGVTAVLGALRGCSQVTAVDISAAAVRNTEMNVARHGMGDRVRVLGSDVFDALAPGERFDVIFWNSNVIPAPEGFVYTRQVQRAIFDRCYEAHRRYLCQGPQRLSGNGRLFLGFNSLGNIRQLRALASEAGLQVAQRENLTCQAGDIPVTFQLLELTGDPAPVGGV